jgi:formylglycine-generating enzyme required for sulfatase activity
VLAVGYPQISIQGNESKVTDGIISSFSGVRNDENWFQISVPIQGGNSGGPLVTESGGVVGVVVATANVARFYKMTGNFPQNVNYAIKSKVLLEFLKSQNLQNVTAAKGKTTVDAVDASTVMVIAKNGAIDVAYTASPEQLAREKREREMAAANEAKRQKEETLAEQRRQAEERRAEKQRVADSTVLSKRDQAVLKAYPDWQETKDSSIFVAWLAEQKQETSDKLNSPKATDVIAVIRQYHAELPRFANRYAAAQRAQPSQRPSPVVAAVIAPPPSPQPSPPVAIATVTPAIPSNANGWARVPGDRERWTEVLLESIRREGALLRYTYRQQGVGTTGAAAIFGRAIQAAVHCGTRQRSDIESDGSMQLREVFSGTHSSDVLGFVCQLEAASNPTAKSISTLVAGQVVKDCDVCPELVVIPAGTFVMGGSAAELALANAGGVPITYTSREAPQHDVRVTSFAAGRYSVTKGEFGAFVRATAYQSSDLLLRGCHVVAGRTWQADKSKNWHDVGFHQADDHPVVCVSWNDAQAYVKWMSKATGKPYRLLSEAEREYVTRAGTKTSFWWGDTINTSRANYNGNGIVYNGSPMGDYRKATVPVNSFNANPFGLFNVHGNVWEWVEDCTHENYENGPPTDGTAWKSGCSPGFQAIVRGGSWYALPAELRTSFRFPSNREGGFNAIGFRVARDF